MLLKCNVLWFRLVTLPHPNVSQTDSTSRSLVRSDTGPSFLSVYWRLSGDQNGRTGLGRRDLKWLTHTCPPGIQCRTLHGRTYPFTLFDGV